MRLPKFLQRCKLKDWSQRVDFWPKGYPHRITTYADVAALKHVMVTSGMLNIVAIDHLVRDENFWQDLSRFFQSKIDELAGVTVWLPTTIATVHKVPLLCWGDQERGDIP